MRIVLDTNILVGFSIRPSVDFERIFDYIAAHGISLVSEDTIAERFDLLSRAKFRKYIRLDQSIDYAEWYAGISEQVIVTDHVVACRNTSHDKIPSLAVSGKADCIVAGDQDLLDMILFKGIAVYRPAEFIRLFIR